MGRRHVRTALADADLRLQQRQRGSQLMGGVGDEAPLGGDLAFDLRQGLVEGQDQGSQLGLDRGRVERFQRVRVTAAHLVAQAQERRQAPVQAEQGEQPGNGDQQDLVAQGLEP